MRQHTYTNGASVRYPDNITFSHDRNVAMFTYNGEYKVKGEVYFSASEFVTIFDTVCYGGQLYINLNSCIRAAGIAIPQTFAEVDFKVTIGNTEENFKITNWSFLVGETMIVRTHPSEREILVPSSVGTIEVYSEGPGVLSVEGEVYEVSGLGKHITEVEFTTHLAEDYISVEEENGRTLLCYTDYWDSELYFIKVVRGDTCSGSVLIGYYNADGCKRYAVGKLLSEEVGKESDIFINGETSDFNPSEGTPKELIKNISRELELGFADVPDTRNFVDILLNDKVETPWGDMVIVDKSMTRKKGTADYTLKLKYKE